MQCIEFYQEEKYIADFIGLAGKIYKNKENMQNDAELKKLLKGEHCLSRYFKLYKFCIYRKGEIRGRFVLVEYPQDKNIYIGFFECENNMKTARFLFENAEAYARKKDFCGIIGPVNASFWIGYRLKTNFFERRPYTGEPYNPEYYLKLFENSGYKIIQKYTSSVYPKVPKKFRNEKYIRRKEDFENRGYRIVSPDMKNWDKIIGEIYALIKALYKDFPVYKEISEEDFRKQFGFFKKIINMNMVKIAYYKKEAVGFYISLPNYHNLIYHTNRRRNLLGILRCKFFPKSYLSLYMGVLPEHAGLGRALVQSIIEELKKKGLPSIGALQREGIVAQFYVRELIRERYEYALLKKEL